MSERSSRKRKAEVDENGSDNRKRQKSLSSSSPEEVTEIALKLVESMKNAKDKTGRSISTLFLTLPDRDELPDYYQLIQLPVAIDTVEDKLRSHEYATLTEVESDFKRMVANAKEYNDDDSEVFADAERVRKLLHNWMKSHNPAYRDPNYVAFPTPVPQPDTTAPRPKSSNGSRAKTAAPVAKQEEAKVKRPTITLSKGRRASEMQPSDPPVASKPAAAQLPKASAEDYKGKTFGQVQEQILEDFVQYRDDEQLQVYLPFVNLPSRSLTDYYQLIRKPMCLKLLQKKARGQHGRDAATGVTEFKTWDAFEDEVAFVWKNAKEYNEDGSDMFALATEFEAQFKARMAEIKTIVDEPQAPRIKLTAKPKTILHLGAKGSQSNAPAPTVAVDNEALERQKQHVEAGVNGQTPQPSQRSGSSAPAETTTAVPIVKTEPSVASPAPDSARPISAGSEAKPSPASSMPPPARLPSTSPHPSAAQPTAQTQASPQPPPTQTQPAYTPTLAPALATWTETFARNKPVTEALLPTIHLSSHPQLAVSKRKPFALDIAASPAFVHQSITLTLPSSCYYLQLAPTVSQQLSSGRQYKLFVTVNGVRVSPSMRPLVNGDLSSSSAYGAGAGGAAGAYGQPLGQGQGGVERKQVYDVSLAAGVNRVEVEIVAVTGRGGTLEAEKTTIFANLLRQR